MSDLTEVREMYLVEVRRAEKAETELAKLTDCASEYLRNKGTCASSDEELCPDDECYFCDLWRLVHGDRDLLETER